MPRPRIDDDAQWEACKERIRILYVNHDLQFKEVRAIIADEYDFKPSEFRYREKLKAWGFRKNLARVEWARLEKALGKRERVDKETEIRVSGQLINSKRLRRSRKRYQNEDISDETTTPVLESSILLRTPSPQVLRSISIEKTPSFQMRVSTTKSFPLWLQRTRRPGAGETGIQNTAISRKGSLTQRGKLNSATILNGSQGLADAFAKSVPTQGSDVLAASDSPYAWASIKWDQMSVTFSGLYCMEDISTLVLEDMVYMLACLHPSWTRDIDESILTSIVEQRREEAIKLLDMLHLQGQHLSLTLGIVQHCAKLASNAQLSSRTADHLAIWIYKLDALNYIDWFLSQDSMTVEALKLPLLISASKRGLSDLIQIVLARGASLDGEMTFMGDLQVTSPLLAVIRNQQYSIFWMILARGPSCANLKCDLRYNRECALCSAIGRGLHDQYVEHLISHGAKVIGVNCSPLVKAVKTRKCSLVKVLLHAGACPNESGTALETAIASHDKDIVRLQVDYGADVNPHLRARKADAIHADNTHDIWSVTPSQAAWSPTPIQAACIGNDIDIARILVDAGADVNACPWVGISEKLSRCLHYGVTPASALQFAVINKNMELAMYLRAAGAEIDTPGYPHTDLQTAALCADLGMFEFLLKEGADFEAFAKLHDGERALEFAVKAGSVDLARRVVKTGTVLNSTGARTLHKAVASGCTEMIHFLLELGVDVNAPASEYHRTNALQAAVEVGAIEDVQLLLGAGADVNASPYHDNGRTALQAAVEINHLGMIDLLLGAGADVNGPAATYKGRTCLQAAARALNPGLVRYLLTCGADPNGLPAESAGLSALQMAMMGIIEIRICRVIDEKRPVIGTASMWMQNVKLLNHSEYYQKRLRDFQSIFWDLISAGANVNAPASSDSYISTAGLVVWIQERTYLHALVSCGLQLESNVCTSSPIIVSIVLKDKETLKYLIELGVDIHARGMTLENTNYCGWTPLSAAAFYGGIEMVEQLFAAGATLDTHIVDTEDFTPLSSAVERCDVDLVRLLTKKGADPNQLVMSPRMTESTMTPLEIAFFSFWCLKDGYRKGNSLTAIVKILLDAGADISLIIADKDWFTPLDISVIRSDVHIDVLKMLINAGADVNAPPSIKMGKTALQAAAEHGDMDKFQVLLDHKANINAPASSDGEFPGMTALQAAAIHGHLDVVILLLKNGASVSAPGASNDGRHALEGAAENGRLDTVVLLFDNDDEPCSFHKRCLEAAERAADQGHKVVEKFLRERAAIHVEENA